MVTNVGRKPINAMCRNGTLLLLCARRVDTVNKKVELSLRLSQVDPDAAKRKRMKSGEKKGLKKKKQKLSSGGESVEEKE